jgi:hypothetical protein
MLALAAVQASGAGTGEKGVLVKGRPNCLTRTL